MSSNEKISYWIERRDEIIDKVIETGKGRKRAYVLESEADFLCGAMAVMAHLGIEPPPAWVFGIMSGDSLLD
jgi:hypothetical protein